MTILLHWLSLSVAFWIVAAVLPGVHLKNIWTGIGVAAVYAILNLLLGWPLRVLLTAISFPLVLLTLGLFLLFIRLLVNTAIVWATDKLVEGFKIDGLGWTAVTALSVSLVSHVMMLFLR